jgi:hypothetical protein
VADQISPFPEWEEHRGQIEPFIGERATSLFAFAIFDEADGFEGAAYFRELLAESGTDVDSPSVTESEGLLIRWGRLVAKDAGEMPADVVAEFERAFSASLRKLLTEFAALTVATAVAEQRA